MKKPKRKRTSAQKRKGKIVVRTKAVMRTKGAKSGKNQTLPPQAPRDNGVTLKVRVKKKRK